MEVFSLIKSSLAPEDTNPIHRLYRVGHQVGACGQEMVWRIHDAESIEEEKVCDVFYFSLNISSPQSHSEFRIFQLYLKKPQVVFALRW